MNSGSTWDSGRDMTEIPQNLYSVELCSVLIADITKQIESRGNSVSKGRRQKRVSDTVPLSWYITALS